MSESTFYSRYERDFAEWARAQGWVVTKQGWPDFICRRGGEVMAVEVKGGSDGLRSEQIAAIHDLRAAGMPTYMWTPETGLTSPVSNDIRESVLLLEMQNEKLRQLVQRAVSLSMEVQTANRPEVRRLRQSPAMIEAEIAEWCYARHHAHRSSVPGSTMALCAWLYVMRDAMTMEQMARMTGQEPDRVESSMRELLKRADVFSHREAHKLLKGQDAVCSWCAQKAS